MASHKCLSYTIATKLQVVQLAGRPSKEAAARQFKVDPKRTHEWCQQEDSLVEMNKRRVFLLAKKTSRELDEKPGRPDRFMDMMAFYYTSFLYAICVPTSYDGHQ